MTEAEAKALQDRVDAIKKAALLSAGRQCNPLIGTVPRIADRMMSEFRLPTDEEAAKIGPIHSRPRFRGLPQDELEAMTSEQIRAIPLVLCPSPPSVDEMTAMLKEGKPILFDSPIRAEVAVVIDLDPMGAPRMTRRDGIFTDPNHLDPKKRQRPCVTRYFAWKNAFVPACKAAGYSLGPMLHADFEIAMPASWSKKKKAAHLGALHHQRPDIDNICKAVMDSFGLEDGHVASLQVTKRWAEKGRIILYR